MQSAISLGESGLKMSAASPACSGRDVTLEQAAGRPAANASHKGKLAASNFVGTIAHVASRYSRQAMCARTIEVYEELLFPETSALVEAAPAAVVA